MQKLMRMMHKNEKGFTLVELMVVVVIIGILVAIAIPIYNTVTANAEERACHANQRTIDGAITMYQAGEGTTPTTVAQLIDEDYLQESPVCPTNNVGPYEITNGLVVGCPDDGDTDHGRYQGSP